MSRIPQPFIDDLLNRLDIVEIVDKRVKLKKTGKNYSACCPFHNEKTPSFTVSQDKQFYYCFGCGASGNALGFVMEFDKTDFVDAVESLASSAGLQVPKEESHSKSSKPKQDFKSLYKLLADCSEFYQEQLKEHPDRSKAVKYLQERGLTGHIAKTYGMGYAPQGWNNLLSKFGLTEDDCKALITAGMVIDNTEDNKRYDRFRHRIMFPILDTRGRTIGFGGRVLGEENRVGADGKKMKGGGPKYLNSPETPVFHKGKELYGLYQARQANRTLKHLLVVEGYMDVIALAQYGITNAVATLGTACGEEHLKLAFKYTNTIVFCFDGDKAGRTAAKRALENAIPVMHDGYQIQFLFVPEGQDPDSLVRQIGPERFAELVAKGSPLEEFFFDVLSEDLDTTSMGGRARLSKLAAPLLHKLPKSVYRELMFELLAQRTGLNQDILQELIAEPVPKLAPDELTPTKLQSPDTQHDTPPPHDDGFIPAFDGEPTPYESYFAQQVPLNSTSANTQTQQLATHSSKIKLPAHKLAIRLLLENPALAHRIQTLELPESPETTHLLRLFHFLKLRENPTFNSIVGAWLGIFGPDAKEDLLDATATEVLGQAKKSPAFDDYQELQDALSKLQQQADERQRRQALSQLHSKPFNTLSPEDKQQLLDLLASGKSKTPSKTE
ncbi:DNA primase [Marinagarivorans algicola]|uniref:DNA primase n=1 Tax=Marinagarivorans algicola TaxID=1513270 RepID=UPI0006B4E6C3|nr:DNA primase [Marinagarivorans algicola]